MIEKIILLIFMVFLILGFIIFIKSKFSGSQDDFGEIPRPLFVVENQTAELAEGTEAMYLDYGGKQ